MVLTARSLRVDADRAALAEVRRFVRSAATDAGAPAECLHDIVQAVDEAATNIVVHGYGHEAGPIDIDARVEDEQIVIELRDRAPAFDPTEVPEPDLSIPPLQRRPGGMGLHLIRLSTDSMTYRPRAGGGNILTLTRTLDPRPKEER